MAPGNGQLRALDRVPVAILAPSEVAERLLNNSPNVVEQMLRELLRELKHRPKFAKMFDQHVDKFDQYRQSLANCSSSIARIWSGLDQSQAESHPVLTYPGLRPVRNPDAWADKEDMIFNIRAHTVESLNTNTFEWWSTWFGWLCKIRHNYVP